MLLIGAATSSLTGVSTQFGTDDMRIFSPSLGLRIIEDRHTSEHIADMLKEICEEWGILPSLVVSDNASNALGSSLRLADFVDEYIGTSLTHFSTLASYIAAGVCSDLSDEDLLAPESHKLEPDEDIRLKVAEAMTHEPE